MGQLYGKETARWSGWMSLIYAVIAITVSMALMAELAPMVGLSPIVMVAFTGSVITGYSIWGVRPVAITDILQFICLGGGLLFFSHLSLHKCRGLYSLWEFVRTQHPEKSDFVLGLRYYNNMSVGSFEAIGSQFTRVLWRTMPVFFLVSPAIQRPLMIQDKRRIGRMFLLFVGVSWIFVGLCIVIGFAALKWYDGPELSEGSFFPLLYHLAPPTEFLK